MKPEQIKVQSIQFGATANGDPIAVITSSDGKVSEYVADSRRERMEAFNEWYSRNPGKNYPVDAFDAGWDAAMKSGEVCRKEDFSNALFILISCYGLISKLNVPGSANLSRVIGSFLDEHVKGWRK